MTAPFLLEKQSMNYTRGNDGSIPVAKNKE
jgi:hypothetical protein